jgi:hypothetical protein
MEEEEREEEEEEEEEELTLTHRQLLCLLAGVCQRLHTRKADRS